MFSKSSLNYYSVVAGIFFIVSGTGKLIDISAFITLINQYGFAPLKLLAPVIVIAEIVLGLMLVLLIRPHRAALYALILLIIFTLLFTYGYFVHGINNCGCFGTLLQSGMSPLVSFIRNFILAGVLLIIILKYPTENGKIAAWKKWASRSTLIIAVFIAGYTLQHHHPMVEANLPQLEINYLHRSVQETSIAKYLKISPHKKYLVFCFSYGCPHCWNSIANLEQYKKTKMVDTVIAFAVGDDSDKDFFYKHFDLDFGVKKLEMDTMRKITNLFPTAFFISNDTVKVFLQSELPSVATFIKYHEPINDSRNEKETF